MDILTNSKKKKKNRSTVLFLTNKDIVLFFKDIEVMKLWSSLRFIVLMLTTQFRIDFTFPMCFDGSRTATNTKWNSGLQLINKDRGDGETLTSDSSF